MNLATLYAQLAAKLTTIRAILTGMNPDTLLPDWSVTVSAHHNVRVLCDLEGLTYDQKQVLTACVMVESGFDINAHNDNYAFSAAGQKYLSSEDFGIVQVNSFWHIGQGKDFPSSEYVLAHSEECVRWMCRYYKQNGHLNAWCSFDFGKPDAPFREWLGRV